MEPMTSLALTAASKGGASAALKVVVPRLARATFRWRVALAVKKKASKEKISLSVRDLNKWLKDDAASRALEDIGGSDNHRKCVADLAAIGTIAGDDPIDVGSTLLSILRDEMLRKLPQGDALLEVARRSEAAVASMSEDIRGFSGSDRELADALSTLHPWRRAEALKIAASWPEIRGIVMTFSAAEADRPQLLSQWSEVPPKTLSLGPAETWTWLGLMAFDYGVTSAGISLLEEAIKRGSSAVYLGARARLQSLSPSERSLLSEGVWSKTTSVHPTDQAREALMASNPLTAENVLVAWAPTTQNDRAICAQMRMSAAAAMGEFNRVVAIGQDSCKELPDASGVALRTAEALLSRGYHGNSANALDDFARAYELGMRARDVRRNWYGDSVAAALVAVQGAVLAGDMGGARSLMQPPPEGSALPTEVRDIRFRSEAAKLAALVGDFMHATQLAAGLNNEYLNLTINGFEALDMGQPKTAQAAWMAAWKVAPDDLSRLETASELAPLGGELPDLGAISPEYEGKLEHIRLVHQVMTADEDPIPRLRARASESKQLTVILAEQLSMREDHESAAKVLQDGANKWGHPLLMQMATSQYMRARKLDKAFDAASSALGMGGAKWPGRLRTLMLQFEVAEALNRTDVSLTAAREMFTLAPENQDVVWALANSLARRGDLTDAWSVLTHGGEPVRPRSESEAKTWISLAAAYDDSPLFVARSLRVRSEWDEDPEISGIFLAQILRAVADEDRQVAESDRAEFARVISEYSSKYPDSPTFQTITIDDDDPLASLTDLVKSRKDSPELRSLREKVEAGQLPMGFLAEMTGKSYLESAIRQMAGAGYINSPESRKRAVEYVTGAINDAVVVDSTSVATLGLLDDEIADLAWGLFLTVRTTDHTMRDAHDAQRSLAVKSSASVGWDDNEGRLRVIKFSEEEVAKAARLVHRSVSLLSRAEIATWPNLQKFDELGDGGPWLTTLDFATSNKLPYWCDDRVLRVIAESDGVPTFGTVDILHYLMESGALSAEMMSVAIATLIHNFNVDFEFSSREFHFAAEMAAWQPSGAAHALTRDVTWNSPGEVLGFVVEGVEEMAETSPDGVRGWVRSAAIGSISVAGDDVGATKNLRILLWRLVSHPAVAGHVLPFVIDGIRDGLRPGTSVEDPFRYVAEELYRRTAAEQGDAAAAKLLMQLVGGLSAADQQTAAGVVLLSHRR